MLYKEYKQKLLKLQNAFEIIWRFRILILVAVVLLIVLLSTLLGITGNIYGEACPDTVIYGNEIPFEAKAIFKKISVEYREQGSQIWAEEQPRQVGSYEVRAVSKSITGAKKYGKIFTCSILPLTTELIFAEDGLVYGETPTASAELVYTDHLVGIDFDYEWLSDNSCRLTANVDAIINEDGEDVTECYKFTSLEREVVLIQRGLTISVDGATKVYDGTPLSMESYQIVDGTVVEGDEIILNFESSLTDAGQIENQPSCAVINNKGEDVTRFYDIQLNCGALTVVPRNITLQTVSAEKIYDGAEFSFPEFNVNENTPIINGHSIEAESFAVAVDAGVYENTMKALILDADGRDVTNNYSIHYDYGTLTVISHPLTVVTGSYTWIYDGQPHSLAQPDDYEIIGLLDGNIAQLIPESVIIQTEITDSETEVGYVENSLKFTIRDSDGNDVTENYQIINEYGRLRIKTEVIINLYGIKKYYDGKPLAFEPEDYTVVKPPDVRVEFELPSLTEVGTVAFDTLYKLPVNIYDKTTGVDVANENRYRFEGDADNPILEVMKRKIELTSISVSKIHDGNVLYGNANENSAWISLGSLVAGHTIEIAVVGILTPEEFEPKENTIDLFSTKIYDSLGNDVTEFYEISIHPGTLRWIY